MSRIKIYNPKALAKPAGSYSHVARVCTDNLLFIAGQVPLNSSGKLVGEGNFDTQAQQVFQNIRAALRSAGAEFRNIVQTTTYLVDSRDIPKLMKFRECNFKAFFPDGKFPPNTLLIVDRLIWKQFRIEIAVIAAPD
ncbi:MAG: RidA family protein [Sulfuricaulis sp.]|uniref:RidA family protein n=1 Tax=Sulfuricaulis sp. TaxID=2003553 RepID=UPI0034A39531